MKSILNRFEAYLLTEKRVSQNTYLAYKKDLEQLVDFLNTYQRPLESVSLTDFKRYLLYLKKNNVTPRSVARKISAIKLFFSWAESALGWVNKTEPLKSPKIEKKLPQFLSEQHIEQLFAAAASDKSTHALRNKVMLSLMYVSGMRVSELIKLKKHDIYFDTGFIAVQGKGSKDRMIPVPQTMLELLREYLTYKQNYNNKHVAQSDYIFGIMYGGAFKPLSRQSFWIILKKLCQQANITQHVSPHTLRHSLATHLLKKGAHLRALQLLLGHEQLSTVAIYTHVETSHLRVIYDKKHPRAR